MKILFAAFAMLVLACGVCRADDVPLSVRGLGGKRIMVLGDSITQDGRYVAFLEYYLLTLFPGIDFDVVNLGLASETVSGLSEVGHAGGAFPRPCLHERLGRALEKVKPGVVLACYGMNDGIYQGPSPERMKAYQHGLTKLVEQSQAAGARVVLVTPPVFDSATANWPHYKEYDAVLTDFATWIMTAPTLQNTVRIDLHTAMKQALEERQKADPRFHFATDGVHPGDLGHLVMAHVILRGLGAGMRDDASDAELARVKSDPMFALVNNRRIQRSKAWMDYVGYTRERVVPPHGDIRAAEQQAAELQRRIDASRERSDGRTSYR